MEDFSAISTFVRVVEAKSFAAAAAQLGMTPSGVSRAVACSCPGTIGMPQPA